MVFRISRHHLAAIVALISFSCAIIEAQEIPPLDASASPQPTPQIVQQPPTASALAQHGIGSSAKDLIDFLQNGFPRGTDRTKFPAKPEEKCQLAIDAMARLSQMHSKDAVPVITRIAALDMPTGVNQLIAEDLSRTTAEGQQTFRVSAMRLLQYNAVNALGVIGDPSSLQVIRAVFTAETNQAARIQYALAMACLGDYSGLDFIVDIIQLANRRESAAAARVFYFITGQSFGYTENTPLRARKTRAKAYADWLKANRQLIRIEPAKVMERRSNPSSITPIEPRSTRDLVKLSTYYFDFENRLHSREARERLALAGKAVNSDLQKLALDDLEDLDVRLEAINWYFEANKGDSRSLLRKLRRDENPEIADKANSLLDHLDQDERRATPAIGSNVK